MNENLATYLNDHLAGSVAGIEIAKHLEEHASTEDVRQVLAKLRKDIEIDRDELRALADRLGIEESTLRKATAWIAEKATEVKLHFDDLSGGDLRTYEALEALSLGIEGKRCLWLALEHTAKHLPELHQTDLEDLQRRAEEQRKVVEQLRVEAAKLAFAN